MGIALIQGHIVAPAFYGRAMHLHPALVLVALLIGAKAGGIVGIFFAVPVTVILITVLQAWRDSSIAPEDKTLANEPTSIDRLVSQ